MAMPSWPMRSAPARRPPSSSGRSICRRTSAPLPQVVVADALRALQDLAAWWRSRHAVRVVGITGSTGKTIAKEITADVLSRGLATLRNEGNLNSETGLPITLLRLEPSHEAAVLEMSMYTVGEIALLAEIARPEVGVVLAVHPTHLERAGSIERIAAAKAELPAALPRDGLAVLNADDPRVAAMAQVTPAAVRTFGLGPSADVGATDVVSHGLAGTEFTVRAPWTTRRMRSGTPGRHLVPHALAALAVAERLGIGIDDAAEALAAGSHAAHRMQVVEAASGATLVDDTYNASPVSVAAALDFLAETPLPAGRRRIAVLGDMLELGPDEERLHREIGARAAAAADMLVTVGPRGAWIAEGAAAAGAAPSRRAADAEEAVAVLEREVAPGRRRRRAAEGLARHRSRPGRRPAAGERAVNLIDIVVALLLAFVGMVILAPIYISLLQRLGYGKQIRTDGPEAHYGKAGTPTMGGMLVVVVVLFLAMALRLEGPATLTPMLTLVGVGILGAIDDFVNVRSGVGMRGRWKLVWQTGVAILAAVYIWSHYHLTGVNIPLVGQIEVAPVLLIGFIAFVIVGTSNAVNLTDGLDGLAGGVLIFSFVAYLLISLVPVAGHQARAPGAGGLLRARHRCADGLPLVQRPPGADLHGRLRVAEPRRHAGGRRHRERPAAAAGDRRDRLLRGDHERGHPGAQLPVPRAAHLPHDAAAPPLRAHRLGGGEDHAALLDRRGARRAARLQHLPRQRTSSSRWTDDDCPIDADPVRRRPARRCAPSCSAWLAPGVAASRFLADAGAVVAAYDRRPASELADAISALGARPVRLALDVSEAEAAALLEHADLLVTSPSVSARFPTTDPWLREALLAAEARGAEVISEVDLFLRLTRCATGGRDRHEGQDHDRLAAGRDAGGGRHPDRPGRQHRHAAGRALARARTRRLGRARAQ